MCLSLLNSNPYTCTNRLSWGHLIASLNGKICTLSTDSKVWAFQMHRMNHADYVRCKFWACGALPLYRTARARVLTNLFQATSLDHSSSSRCSTEFLHLRLELRLVFSLQLNLQLSQRPQCERACPLDTVQSADSTLQTPGWCWLSNVKIMPTVWIKSFDTFRL